MPEENEKDTDSQQDELESNISEIYDEDQDDELFQSRTELARREIINFLRD
jgi:hypothetical protein